MRADRSGNRKERRRRSGAVSLPFLSRNGGEEGRERKQDKGSVSRHCISVCLHILFLGGRRKRPRDMAFAHGRNAPFSFSNRETQERRSEERRLGKESVSKGRYRWAPVH